MPTTTTPDFIIPFYKDDLLAFRLINQIRTHYPDALIVALSDGTRSEKLQYCKDTRKLDKLITGLRLKPAQFGGQWLSRWLTIAQAHGRAKWVIKIEPDSFLCRQFESFPTAEIGGTLKRPGFVRGGCIGIQRQTIDRILASELIDRDKYCDNPHFSYRRYSTYRLPSEKLDPRPLALCDAIFADVLQDLQIEPVNWNEVDIQFRNASSMEKDKAVIGPVRD